MTRTLALALTGFSFVACAATSTQQLSTPSTESMEAVPPPQYSGHNITEGSLCDPDDRSFDPCAPKFKCYAGACAKLRERDSCIFNETEKDPCLPKSVCFKGKCTKIK